MLNIKDVSSQGLGEILHPFYTTRGPLQMLGLSVQYSF